MRLTVDVIQRAHIWINPLKQRELNLRGYKAPAIENLGVTKDGFDCIDLSDNEIKKLENFPRLRRLRTLLLNNNHVSKFHENLAESIENLEYLILTGNRVASLAEIEHLVPLKKLDTLSLMGNPVAKRKYYREYVIHKLPHLRVLDFQKIKPREREAAAVFFNSMAGKRIEQEAEGTDVEMHHAAPSSALPPPPPPPAVVSAVPPPPPKTQTTVAVAPPSAPVAPAAPVAKPVSPVKLPQAPKPAPVPAPVPVSVPAPTPVAAPQHMSPPKPKSKRAAEDVEMETVVSPVKRSASRAAASKLSTPSKPPPSAQDTEMAEVPYTPSKPIQQQTVTQLREALKERGLSTKGLKAELVKRLKEAVGSA